MISEIDFVVTWVDDLDPEWQTSYIKHKVDNSGDFSPARVRNWDNFHYWLRGIEKYCPWVRKIHLITEGHLPSWLNTDHSKLNIVKHSDYISSEFLPTFNSRVIENSIYLIKDLSEKFVLFNDDFFVIDHIDEKRFFIEDKPCDMAILNALSGGGESTIIMNELSILNQHYRKHQVMQENYMGWFNFKYRTKLLKNILLLSWPCFTGFVEPHFPQPYLKSSWKQGHKVAENEFTETNYSKFRKSSDINHYLIRYIQLVEGNFYPLNLYQNSIYLELDDAGVERACEILENQSTSILVLNDAGCNDFENAKKKINLSFALKFPNQSTFEIN